MDFYEWSPDSWEPAQKAIREKSHATVDHYRNDSIVVRPFMPASGPPVESRGLIGDAPTKTSLNRLIFILNNADIPFVSMFTLTLAKQVESESTVEELKCSLRACLERMRKKGINQYCWVREFQGNNSVHWHVFTDLDVGEKGEVNYNMSKDWSRWYANYWEKKGKSKAACSRMRKCILPDFAGCCRVEQLSNSASGRYAAKEGAKRFQKVTPAKWKKTGGAWWRGSRGIKCTKLSTELIPWDELQFANITAQGKELKVPFKVQFGTRLQKGTNLLSP